MPSPSNFDFGIMADGHDELTGGDVMVNAVDHAATAEGQSDAGVIASAAGHSVSQVQTAIFREYQTMGGSFGHGADYPESLRRAIY